MITEPPKQPDLQPATGAQSSSSSSSSSNQSTMIESRVEDESVSGAMSVTGGASGPAQQYPASNPGTTLCSSQQQKMAAPTATTTTTIATTTILPKLIEKSVIIHKDENGFGLRIKGQTPVYIEHVHEGGAAWRAGVRALDSICKVNGIPVKQLDHKDVVLIFKSCSRFVALTLISPEQQQQQLMPNASSSGYATINDQPVSMISDLALCSHQRQYSIYNHRQPPDHDRRLVSVGAAADSSSLFGADSCSLLSDASSSPAPMMSQLTSSLLFVDRTKSFKSALNLAPSSSSIASDQIRHLALQQLHHQRLGRVTSSSQLDSTSSQSRGGAAAKLNRRDSTDDTGDKLAGSSGDGNGDKRLAICTSCQQEQQQFKTNNRAGEPVGATTCSQCKLKLGTTQMPDGQLTQKGQLSQLHASLRDTKMNSRVASQQQLAASDQNLATNDKSSRVKAAKVSKASPLVSASPPTTAAPAKSDVLTSCKAVEVQSQPAPPAKPKVVVNRRIEIIREFIDTERTHTERLRCLDELFYRPLKQANFMNGEQLRMVFSCHRTLYKIHRQIYRILLSANYDFYSEPLIGSALLEIFEGDLKRRLERASCSFCSAQATNIELLNKFTRRDTKVGEFLAQVTSQRMIGRLGIKDLLASCFQRLTKYPLLLENLLKATPQVVPSDDDDDDDDGEDFGNDYADDASTKRASQINRLRLLASPTLSRSRRSAGSGCGQRSVSDDECGAGGESDEDGDNDDDGGHHDEAARQARLDAAEEARLNTRRMLAISLAEEREFIERALYQSRQILVKVNDSIRVAVSRLRLKEIWKRTDKYPGVPLIDITKQQVIHEGLLTLRLSKRSFDVYVLLLNDYIIILTREGQDKYRLKFFTPEGKSASASASSSVALSLGAGIGATGSSGSGGGGGGGGNSGSLGLGTGTASGAGGGLSNLTTPQQTVYSPVFVIDEHLTTRDAATDENGFYLLCKRKDDSRIYEFASRSPAERMKWRDKIQWAIERQMSRHTSRRPSCGSILTKSSSEISAGGGDADQAAAPVDLEDKTTSASRLTDTRIGSQASAHEGQASAGSASQAAASSTSGATADSSTSSSSQQCSSTAPDGSGEPTKIVGTISYVIDDGIVMPSKMESSRVFVDQAIQVNILDGTTVKGGGSGGEGVAGLKATS